MQTPQAFSFPLILNAHRALEPGVQVTDDTAVARLAGHGVFCVPGDKRSLKITTKRISPLRRHCLRARALRNKGGSSMYTETKTLSNGVEMPMFGLGTWQIANEEAYRVVSEALSLGYRAVDTAAGYQNEEGSGALYAAAAPHGRKFSSQASWPPKQRAIRRRLTPLNRQGRRSAWIISTCT